MEMHYVMSKNLSCPCLKIDFLGGRIPQDFPRKILPLLVYNFFTFRNEIKKLIFLCLNTTNTKMSLIQIPRDVLQLVADKLEFKDLLELKKTCKYVRNLKIVYIPWMLQHCLTDEILNRNDMKYFSHLEIDHRSSISEVGLKGLYNLRHLFIDNTKTIDISIISLTQLRSLYIIGCQNITDVGIMGLTNLTELDIDHNHTITDSALLHLTKLQTLHIESAHKITDKGISHLTNLIFLNAGKTNITDDGIKNLTKLDILWIHRNTKITNSGLMRLTNLHALDISECVQINNDGIKHLTNLTALYSSYNPSITRDVISYFPNLQQFNRERLDEAEG